MTRPATTHQEGSHDRGQGQNVILYLPPGPIFQGFNTRQTNEKVSQVNAEDTEQFLGGPLSHLTSSVQQVLATKASATVVTINYRLGGLYDFESVTESQTDFQNEERPEQPISTVAAQPRLFQFPTPVHDTLAGFDWIQNNLKPAKLGVLGSHVGGSLALMLALTEARLVHAAAAISPVCDWPGLDEYCAAEALDERAPTKKQKRNPKSKGRAPWDLLPLLQARERFFATPEKCFDAFASPILLLRSAGREVPKSFPQYHTGPDYPVPVLKSAQETAEGSLWDRDLYPDIIDSEDNGLDNLIDKQPPIRRRKALSRWPPYGLDYGISGGIWSGPAHGVRRLQVTLPWVRVLTDEAAPVSASVLSNDVSRRSLGSQDAAQEPSVLAQQAEEMVSVMRRACFWGQEKGVGESRVALAQADSDLEDDIGRWFGGIWDRSTDGG